MEKINTSHTGRSCLHSHHSCWLCMIMENFFDQPFHLSFFARMTQCLFLHTGCLFRRLFCCTFGLFFNSFLFPAYFPFFFKCQKLFHIRKLQTVKFSLNYDLIYIFRACNVNKIKTIGCKKCGYTVVHLHMNTLRHKFCTASAVQALYFYFQEMTVCRIPSEILYPLNFGKIKLHPKTVSCKFSLCIKRMFFTEALTKIIVNLTVHLVFFSFSVHQLCYGNRYFFLFKRKQGSTSNILINKMHGPFHEDLIICVTDFKFCHHIIFMYQLWQLRNMSIQFMDQTPHNEIHRYRKIKHPFIINDLILAFTHENITADQIHIGRADTFIICSSGIFSKYLTELFRSVIHDPAELEKIPMEILKKSFELPGFSFMSKFSDFLMKSFSGKKRIADFSVFCLAWKIFIFIRACFFRSKLFQGLQEPLCLRHHGLFFCTDLSVLTNDLCQKPKLFLSFLIQFYIENFFLLLSFCSSGLHKERIHKTAQDLLFFKSFYPCMF